MSETQTDYMVIYDPPSATWVLVPDPFSIPARTPAERPRRASVPRLPGMKVRARTYPRRVRLAPFKRHCSTHEN